MPDRFPIPANFKIVSGGQTGADRAGLDWAIAHGIAHGGWCPKGRRSEDGKIPAIYILTESASSNYLVRTENNVRDSDATVIFTLSDKIDGGTKKTVEFAKDHGKAWIHMRPGVHPKYLARFLDKHQVAVMNIAGKRESTAPGIGSLVHTTLDLATLF